MKLTQSVIDQLAIDCRKAVRWHAVGSGLGSAVPLPGASLATDAVLVAAMLNEILRRFGLRKSDIDMADIETKAVLLTAIRTHGCKLVGRVVNKELVVQLLVRTGRGHLVKSMVRFVPVLGQVVVGGISYFAMRQLGELMIHECVQVTYAMRRL